MANKYDRVMLKLSGEALTSEKNFRIDTETVNRICEGVREAQQTGAQIAIVVGGGNFWRGRSGGEMERTRSDQIGMLATVMNALAVADALERMGWEVRVQTALTMTAVAEPYIRRRAERHFEKGRVVIFGAGTGNPYFTTDTAAVLRAQEIHAELLLKATKVDGIYSSDPMQNKDAVRYDTATYMEVLAQQWQVMDRTAISLAMDNNLPLVVFKLMEKDNLIRIICGEKIGTQIS